MTDREDPLGPSVAATRGRWVREVWEQSARGGALYLTTSERLVRWAREELARRAGGAARTGAILTVKGLQERFPPPEPILPELESRLLQAEVARRSGDGGGGLPSSGYLQELYQAIEELEGRWPAPPSAYPPSIGGLIERWRSFRAEVDRRGRRTAPADLWDLPRRLERAGFSPSLVVFDGWTARTHADRALRAYLRDHATRCVDLDAGEGGSAEGTGEGPPPLVPPEVIQAVQAGIPDRAGIPLPGPVRLTAYRNEQDEVEGLARRLRETLDQGPGATVMVALADLPSYADRVLEVFPRYGLRPQIELRPPLRSDASSQVLRVLLAVFGEGFDRPSVLELLQTLDSRGQLRPWWDSPLETIRRVLALAGSRSGREDYTRLVEEAPTRLDRLPPDLHARDFAEVARGFRRLFDVLPESRAQPLAGFLERLEEARRALEGRGPALSEGGDAPGEVLARARELNVAPEGEDWPVRDLRAFVDLVLSLAPAPGRPFRLGVPVSGLRDAGVLTVDHLFVGGLRQGAFPSAGPGPLVPADVRRALGLPRDEDLLMEERETFLRLLGRARRTLELSYPRRAGGEEALRSPFLVELTTATGWGAGPPAPRDPGVAYSLKDALLLVAPPGVGAPRPVVGPGGSDGDGPLAEAYRWARRGGQAERERRRSPRASGYDGLRGEANVQDRLLGPLGSGRINVHQVQDYLECAYRFYLQRVLELPVEEPPVEDYDPRTIGTILHKVLEETQRGLVDADGRLRTISPTEVPALVARGAQHIEEELARVRPLTPGLEVARRRLLGPPSRPQEGLLWQTFAFLAEDGALFTPAYVELPFGPQPPGTLSPTGDVSLPAWKIDRGSGREWSLVGRVDRVSWDRQRPGRFLVDDFKTGWSEPVARPRRGDLPALQLPLYAAALSDLLPPDHEAGRVLPGALRYLWLGRPGRVQVLSLTSERGNPDAEVPRLIRSALSLADQALSGIEEGRFLLNGLFVAPGGDGCRFAGRCPFASGCRFDAERLAGTYRREG